MMRRYLVAALGFALFFAGCFLFSQGIDNDCRSIWGYIGCEDDALNVAVGATVLLASTFPLWRAFSSWR